MARSTGEIFVARETGQASVEGYGEILFQKGVTRIREGHPILKQLGHLFEPLTVQFDIEDTTAAPGEKRGEPPAAKKAEPEPARKAAEPEPAKKTVPSTPQKK